MSGWHVWGIKVELLDLYEIHMCSHEGHKHSLKSDLSAYGNHGLVWLANKTSEHTDALPPPPPQPQFRFQRWQIQLKKEGENAQRTSAGVFLHRIPQEGKNVNYASLSNAGLPCGMATGRSAGWLRSHNTALAHRTTWHLDKPNTKLLGLFYATRAAGNSTLMWNESLFKSGRDQPKGPSKFYSVALRNKWLPSFSWGVVP